MPRTERLLPFENPLPRRLGVGFFQRLPKAPGIYRMYGESQSLLYVGKAKNLRERLNSYRHAQPGGVPRKVIRLLHLVRRIEIETLGSETEALLRENELLRTLRPPFNRANTTPQRYLMVGLETSPASRLHLLSEGEFHALPETQRNDIEWFGAFKAKKSTQAAWSALLRLLWAIDPGRRTDDATRFEFPQILTRALPPGDFHLPGLPLPELTAYLRGDSVALLAHLTTALLELEDVPPFYYKLIQDDLEILQSFYERSCARNRLLLSCSSQSTRTWLSGAELDDALVLHQMSKT